MGGLGVAWGLQIAIHWVINKPLFGPVAQLDRATAS